MKKIRLLYITTALSLFSIVFSEQKIGKIMGTVIDSSSKEFLIGASVFIREIEAGTTVDTEGQYAIFNIPPGEYKLEVSYIGYESQAIENIIVNFDETTKVDFALNISGLKSDEILVKARKKTGTSSSLIYEQKKSSRIQDGVGKEQLAKMGDSNVAEGVKRITGVTLVDNKFAIIRGLPDRYTDTQLNSSPITSPEPDKKAVPLDMFPSDIIENIIAVKTATPDLPGSFAAGGIIVKTKPYPEKFVLKFKFSASDNTNNKGPFYLGNDGYNFFGYDSKKRSLRKYLPDHEILDNNNIPDDWNSDIFPDFQSYELCSSWDIYQVQNGINSDACSGIDYNGNVIENQNDWTYGSVYNSSQSIDLRRKYSYYDNLSKLSSNNVIYKSKEISKVYPISFGLSYGNKLNPRKDFEWGYFTNLTFGNKFTDDDIYTTRYSRLAGTLIEDQPRNQITNAYKTNLGANLNLGFRFKNNHLLKYEGLYSHNSKNQLKYIFGEWSNIDTEGALTNYYYVENQILSHSLSGESNFTSNKLEHVLDWNITNGVAKRYEPFNRRYSYEIDDSWNCEDLDQADCTMFSTCAWQNNGCECVLPENECVESESDTWNEAVRYELFGHSGEKNYGFIDYTDGDDKSDSFDLNYLVNFEEKLGFKFKFKTGLRLQSKERVFERRQLVLQYAPGFESISSWGGIPDSVKYAYSIDELGAVFDNPNNYFSFNPDVNIDHPQINPNSECVDILPLGGDGICDEAVTPGFLMHDATSNNISNAYFANEDINAAYVMFEFPFGFSSEDKILNKFNFIGGLRWENYKMNLQAYNPISNEIVQELGDETAGIVELTDNVPIPSASINYLIDDKQKIRLSYSESVNRPLFRELAPIDYQEFYGGETVVGYPLLQVASINNYDLRYERYPKPGEVITISYFKKLFTNPVEAGKVSTTDLIYKIYNNSLSAETHGIELELRKNIPAFLNSIKSSQFFINTTISDSKVISDDQIEIFVNGANQSFANQSSSERPIQGQSDLIFNMGYDITLKSRLNIAINYNTFSKRVNSLGFGVAGEEYEMPFNSLNLTTSKTFIDCRSRDCRIYKFTVKVKNILNDDIQYGFFDSLSGQFKPTHIEQPGQSFSIGISTDF